MDKRVIVFIILIIVFLAFFYNPMGLKTEILTNVTDLYSLFTPGTEKYVTYYTKGIKCEPKEYYYVDSQICFLCDKAKPCFEYVWVERTGVLKMNIKNISLIEFVDKQTEYSFYSFGISDLLNCVCNEECICEDGIRLVSEETKAPTGPIFIFPPNIEIESKIEKITKEWEIEEKCEVTRFDNFTEGVSKQIECGILSVLILNNKEVLFGV